MRFFYLVANLFDTLLNRSTQLCAAQNGPIVQRNDRSVVESSWRFVTCHFDRQSFDDGGLANPSLSHQDRVVAAPFVENIDELVYLLVTVDDGIDTPKLGLGQKIAPVLRQRRKLIGIQRRRRVSDRVALLMARTDRTGFIDGMGLNDA